MSNGNLPDVLLSLHQKVERELADGYKNAPHPVTKGDASENTWIELLTKYLPERYRVKSAFIIDSQNNLSQQIDIVIYDRQYSPFIWEHKGAYYIPAESVYAVFEVKPVINAENIRYAEEKARSVKRLYRTNMPVPHAGGVISVPKPLFPILSGILAYKSEWSPGLGTTLRTNLNDNEKGNMLDIGCIANEGIFVLESSGHYLIKSTNKSATAFLFELIRQLQIKATVPMIDITAYAKWLD